MTEYAALLDEFRQLSATETRILDAAVECFDQWGLEKTSVNNIAEKAGITRRTVYAYFPTRRDIVRAALFRQAYIFGDMTLEHVEQFTSVQDRLVEAVAFNVENLPNQPFLSQLQNMEIMEMVNMESLYAADSIALTMHNSSIILKDIDVDEDEFAEMVEVTHRFLLSLLSLKTEKERKGKELRDFLRRRMLPAVGL